MSETDSSPDVPAREADAIGQPVAVVTVLAIMAAGLMALGVYRQLAPNEASILMTPRQTVTENDAAVRIQVAWAAVAGGMERPGRWLGILSHMIAAVGVAFLAGRRHGRAAGLIAAGILAASPVFWLGGTAIGELSVGAAVSTLMLLALAASPLSTGGRASAFLVSAFVVGAGFLLQSRGWLAASSDSAEALLRCGDLIHVPMGPWETPDVATWVAVVIAAGGAALLVRADRSATVDLAMIATVLIACFSPQMGDLRQVAPNFLQSAILPPLALWLATLVAVARRRSPAKAKPVIAIVVALALITPAATIGGAVSRRSPTDHRASLDWVAAHVSGDAVLLTAGPERHLFRYYEHNGHRTGHDSLVIDDAETLDRVARQLPFEKIPVVVAIAFSDSWLAALQDRYEVLDPVQGQPSTVRLLRFRR